MHATEDGFTTAKLHYYTVTEGQTDIAATHLNQATSLAASLTVKGRLCITLAYSLRSRAVGRQRDTLSYTRSGYWGVGLRR